MYRDSGIQDEGSAYSLMEIAYSPATVSSAVSSNEISFFMVSDYSVSAFTIEDEITIM